MQATHDPLKPAQLKKYWEYIECINFIQDKPSVE